MVVFLVAVRGRDRERERQRQTHRQRQREGGREGESEALSFWRCVGGFLFHLSFLFIVFH